MILSHSKERESTENVDNDGKGRARIANTVANGIHVFLSQFGQTAVVDRHSTDHGHGDGPRIFSMHSEKPAHAMLDEITSEPLQLVSLFYSTHFRLRETMFVAPYSCYRRLVSKVSSSNLSF